MGIYKPSSSFWVFEMLSSNQFYFLCIIFFFFFGRCFGVKNEEHAQEQGGLRGWKSWADGPQGGTTDFRLANA